MIQVDAAMAAIFITILLSLIGMGAAWGTLREKVKNNTEAIQGDRRLNREDHLMIFNKLDEIKTVIKNGNK